jgi:predicted small lipoprotein YifL
MRRTALALFAFLILALPLAACGKKGPLEPPAGVPNTYPQTYPRE